MKKTITCAKCGQAIEIDAAMTAGFCLHCGEKFSLPAQPDPVEARQAAALYQAQDWPALQEYVTGADDPESAVYRTLATLRIDLARYEQETQALAEHNRGRNIINILLSKSPPGSEELHAGFHKILTDDTQALAGALGAPGVEEALRAGAAYNAVSLLLREKDSENALFWGLVSCEHLCIPLLSYLPLPVLEEQYAAYAKTNPDNHSLPNQMNVKKEMRRLITEQGGTLPKKKFFG